jgi:hypothetical protein
MWQPCKERAFESEVCLQNKKLIEPFTLDDS